MVTGDKTGCTLDSSNKSSATYWQRSLSEFSETISPCLSVSKHESTSRGMTANVAMDLDLRKNNAVQLKCSFP